MAVTLMPPAATRIFSSIMQVVGRQAHTPSPQAAHMAACTAMVSQVLHRRSMLEPTINNNSAHKLAHLRSSLQRRGVSAPTA
jgi:hypothetical protein